MLVSWQQRAQCMALAGRSQTWHALQQYASPLHLEHCISGGESTLPHMLLPHVAACILILDAYNQLLLCVEAVGVWKCGPCVKFHAIYRHPVPLLAKFYKPIF